MKCVYIFLCLLFILLSFLSYYIYKKFTTESYKNKKGICYFDIDDTLTSATDNTGDIIQECIDKDFAVGIITASCRTIDHICDKNKSKYSWMPDKLCKQFRENGGRMYNSLNTVAGKSQFPKDYPYKKLDIQDYGYIKGYNMKYGRDTFYPHIKDNNVILFDDQRHVIEGVNRFNKDFNSNFRTQCSNDTCLNGEKLNTDFVKKCI